ncbi:hypothetical protein JOC47_000527 [Halanaerobacter jeridensis]|uniref:Uncharacterized protein n=1 Tax=Halanaerobacter jeridensis TaxID=706427 RepID=A0A938XNN2_9FIRM|nr:hypothetical protein [Halanaerobacter jeridensis]
MGDYGSCGNSCVFVVFLILILLMLGGDDY